jgi:hypothetical protein
VGVRSGTHEFQRIGRGPAGAVRLIRGGFPVLLAAALAAALLAAPGSAAAARVARTAPAARPKAAAAKAATAGGTDLYVNDASGSGCSDTGSGTQAQPFCTIAAAAAVVQPGQTVIVEPGAYDSTTISVSGTAADPITFLAADTSDSTAGLASIGYVASQPTPQDDFVVSGAHDVVISGFDVTGDQAMLIENSSDITINGGDATGFGTGIAAIQVTGTSSNITISRLDITAIRAAAVQVDQGVTGAVVTTNTIVQAGEGPGVLVTDAPGTDVTSNTLITECRTAVEVTGTSPGTTLENNIAETGGEPPNVRACTDASDAIAFSVSAGSTPQTVANYNLIDPLSGGPLYVWGGTSYTSLASFTAATGQGANDIAASPGLGSPLGYQGANFWFPLSASSPAINSADANAPGELPTDQLGNPRADDPSVPNTGTGPGYYDRGAVELQGGYTISSVTAQPDPAGGPLDVSASAPPLASTWTTNGPTGTYEFLFSDGTPPVFTSTPTVNHVFSTAGEDQVTLVQSFNGYFWDDPPGEFTGSNYVNLVLGADYTPVYPERIFDTRSGVGVAKGAISPGGSLTIPVGNIVSALSHVSAADISAIAINVTVTGPTDGGTLTVTPGNAPGLASGTSNINFTARQTIANLVTVPIYDGDISVYNDSKGTVQVLADLQGVYSNGGSGFQPVAPVRVLDTRNKIGVTTGPLPPDGGVRLNLSGRLPAGAAAAVLNLTATQPTAGGYVVAYADGQAVPSTSSLNFTAGETVANQVIVPLTDDVADFWNGSPGTVQLVGDLEGYYASGAAGSFVPYGPTRIADTRTGFGTQTGPVPAHGFIVVSPDLFLNGCTPSCPLDSAEVINVTVTQPKDGGFLTVYADGHGRPATSDVNFAAGQTIADLVTTQDTEASVAIYNDSKGTVQIVVDEQGYFINQQ